MKKSVTVIACLGALTLAGCGSKDSQDAPPQPDWPSSPPNILLIVVDDMGYTDIGAFGSEIKTPNLDELALAGVRLTNFHASAQCAPTRSMLMSGTDNHKAGMGSMFGPRFIEGGFGGRRGYERYLHPRVAALPERLRESGYQTYMAGKWHLGGDDEKKPTARGFDKAFALMPGSASHMEKRHIGPKAIYRENGELLESLPDDFYSTNFYTDKLIEYISGADKTQPFFGYLALTSPHWPLQVPDEELDKNRGNYDDGYDAQRAKRLERAEALGVVPRVDPKLFDPIGRPWQELSAEEKRHSARTMELYASMVENLDANVGRLISSLKENGTFDNTFIFFMSDNGAEADREDNNPTHKGGIARSNYYDNSYENLGKKTSWAFLREGWAQASMAPYRLYKGFLTEGGTRVASFAYHPAMTGSEALNGQYLTVMDVMPTFLDVAGAEFDATRFDGRDVLPMTGKSFRPLFADKNAVVHQADEVIASELHGQRSLVRGDYKIVWEQMTANLWWEDEPPEHWQRWRLYNLAQDPTEQIDLAESEPELMAELAKLWHQWADANTVMKEVRPYWRAQ